MRLILRNVVFLRLAGVLLVLLLAAGCGKGDDDDDEQAPSGQSQTMPRVPEPENGTGALPVGDFNDFLEEAQPPFATSALRTAIEFAHAGEGQAATTSVLAAEGPEGAGDQASVTVTRDGIADDSVRAVRYVIELERGDDGTWRLRSAQRLQRCQPERGHQDFSPQLCT
jgi:hypothetical protein